jgi:hypothetical protein
MEKVGVAAGGSISVPVTVIDCFVALAFRVFVVISTLSVNTSDVLLPIGETGVKSMYREQDAPDDRDVVEVQSPVTPLACGKSTG